MYIDYMYKNVDIVEFQVVLFIIHVFILIIFLKFSSIRLKKNCLTAIVSVMEMKMSVGDVKCQK